MGKISVEKLIEFRKDEMEKYKQISTPDCRAKILESDSSNNKYYSLFVRNEFSIDRDRIRFSRAFRRLEHKAQIYTYKKGDHFRTRLTHSLEVTQIARSLARNLKLNEDLVEAISLGHDIGHTPFGHQGERTLDKIMSGEDNLTEKIKYKINYGGFKHNFHSLKILDQHEVKYNEFGGMNLTWQVLEGILRHTKIKRPKNESSNEYRDWDLNRFTKNSKLHEFIGNDYKNQDFSQTLEGQIVAIADEIAQRQHDIDDGLRDIELNLRLDDVSKYLINKFQKLLSEYASEDEIYLNNLKDLISSIRELNKDKLVNYEEILDVLKEKSAKDGLYTSDYNNMIESLKNEDKNIKDLKNNGELYKTNSLTRNLINFFIIDVTIKSLSSLMKYNEDKDNQNSPIFKEKLINFSTIGQKVNDIIENYISVRILNSYNVNRFDGKAIYIVRQLFKAYYTNPRQMPEYILERMSNRINDLLTKYKNKLRFKCDKSKKCETCDQLVSKSMCPKEIKNIKFKDSKKIEIDSLLELLKLEIDLNNLIIPDEIKEQLKEDKYRCKEKKGRKLSIKKEVYNNISSISIEDLNKDNNNIDLFIKIILELHYIYLSTICDYIAGMTDNFASDEFQNLYLI